MLRQVSALKTLFFGYFKDFRSFFIWEAVDNGSDICVSLSSCFELGFLGFQGRSIVVQGSVVVLREFPLSRLVAVSGLVSWFFTVEAFPIFHELLSFRRHSINVHSVWVSGLGVVIGVSSVLSGVVLRIVAHCSHKSSPVVVKQNGFLIPLFNGVRDIFHRHDFLNDCRFEWLLVEVDQD